MDSLFEGIDDWVVVLFVVIIILLVLLYLIVSKQEVYVCGGAKRKYRDEIEGIVIDGLNIYYDYYGMNDNTNIEEGDLLKFVDELKEGLSEKYKGIMYHFVFKNKEGVLLNEGKLGDWKKYTKMNPDVCVYFANGSFGNRVGHVVHGRDDVVVILLSDMDKNAILSNDRYEDVGEMVGVPEFELIKICAGKIMKTKVIPAMLKLPGVREIEKKRFTLGMLI